MLKWIDEVLDTITMYRFILYYVGALWTGALVFSFLEILAFNPWYMIASLLIMLAGCFATNYIFAKVFKAQPNVESVYITAVILALIITPLKAGIMGPQIWLFIWAGALAMASKFILARKMKHIFNPVAIAVFITSVALNQSASWWVGTAVMWPLVLIGGLMMIRKLRRFDLMIPFFITALLMITGAALSRGSSIYTNLGQAFLNTPIMFFAFVMLSEPLTTPPTRWLRVLYGVIVGIIFAPSFHIGSFYATPEIALLIGNVFSYLVSPKEKFMLTLKEKKQLAPDITDFIFEADNRMDFRPGQYLEWTLDHKKRDNRGNRRYFTIASSPREPEIHLGVKSYPNASSFKRSLMDMKPGDQMMVGQLAGDFTLPKDPSKKIVLIAGGIGVTPYRSMIQDLLDRNERRDIELFYSVKTEDQIVYHEIFDEAGRKLGINTIYVVNDKTTVPQNWKGETGYVTADMIVRYVPDFRDRIFYISGPHSMIVMFKNTLGKLGVPRNHIKTDFFPGLV